MSCQRGEFLMVKTDIRNYLRIRPIEEGIVIDHLRPGTGLFILNLLNS